MIIHKETKLEHPLAKFIFCPVCGAKSFAPLTDKAYKCSTCNFVYFSNCASSVAVFIENEKNELLVCRRAKDPYKDTFDLPGGFVDMHETAEKAVIREIKEELNINISTTDYLFSLPNIYPYQGINIHTLDLFFKCAVRSFSGLKPADDVSEIFFLPKNKITIPSFGLPSIQKGIEKYLHRFQA